jgi:hypothetical protein
MAPSWISDRLSLPAFEGADHGNTNVTRAIIFRSAAFSFFGRLSWRPLSFQAERLLSLLAPLRLAECIEQCPLSGETRKTFEVPDPDKSVRALSIFACAGRILSQSGEIHAPTRIYCAAGRNCSHITAERDGTAINDAGGGIHQ